MDNGSKIIMNKRPNIIMDNGPKIYEQRINEWIIEDMDSKSFLLVIYYFLGGASSTPQPYNMCYLQYSSSILL